MVETVVDANILLRHLTGEPGKLADGATELLEGLEARRIRLVVAPLTLAEVVFVLESVYAWNRREIARRLLSLVSASVIEFLERETITRALTWYRDSSAVHFADAYVAALAVGRTSALLSFDRAVKRLSELNVVDTPAGLSQL